MSNVPTPNQVKTRRATRKFGDKLVQDALNLRSNRVASVPVYSTQTPQKSDKK